MSGKFREGMEDSIVFVRPFVSSTLTCFIY